MPQTEKAVVEAVVIEAGLSGMADGGCIAAVLDKKTPGRRRLEPSVRLLKIDAATAHPLRLCGIPTLLLTEDGGEIARTSGAMDDQSILTWTTAGLARSR